jgi:hypothetical protein
VVHMQGMRNAYRVLVGKPEDVLPKINWVHMRIDLSQSLTKHQAIMTWRRYSFTHY